MFSPNIYRFSKFFHWRTLCDISNRITLLTILPQNVPAKYFFLNRSIFGENMDTSL